MVELIRVSLINLGKKYLYDKLIEDDRKITDVFGKFF
jgi:hypothetical protein